jgi:hypothetical protein
MTGSAVWVGVVWDVGTFWPRSAHPLAPPSYAELAVPQKRLPALADMLRPDREVLRWTNFHRDTDPLGWKVHAGQKELWVKDPVALRPKNGEVIDPPIGNHSGYPDTEEYAQERGQVTAILLAPAESPSLNGRPQS